MAALRWVRIFGVRTILDLLPWWSSKGQCRWKPMRAAIVHHPRLRWPVLPRRGERYGNVAGAETLLKCAAAVHGRMPEITGRGARSLWCVTRCKDKRRNVVVRCASAARYVPNANSADQPGTAHGHVANGGTGIGPVFVVRRRKMV